MKQKQIMIDILQGLATHHVKVICILIYIKYRLKKLDSIDTQHYKVTDERRVKIKLDIEKITRVPLQFVLESRGIRNLGLLATPLDQA